VSEQILNSTSAELGYTLPFTLVHAGKYRTEDKSKADTTNTKDNPEKANNTKYSKTKLARFSTFLQHSASRSKQLVRQRTKNAFSGSDSHKFNKILQKCDQS